MKFSNFEYKSPSSVQEAVQLLAASGGTAKVISGGQSLLPTMAFRLASPALLVDLRLIPGLDQITLTPQGVRLGARVRWVDIERHQGLKNAHPLLVEAIKHVAHYQVRNKGTVGGSVSHADPASEMPGISVTCDAVMTIVGPKGTRSAPAAEFIVGALTTDLEPDELVTEIAFPAWPADRKWGFREFARQKGNFALAGVAVFFDPGPSGSMTNVHVGVIGACQRPHRVVQVETLLEGKVPSAALIAEASRLMAHSLEAPEDVIATAEYRRELAATLFERALDDAQGS